jgi:DNA-binding beta-propeller fold protein YncE
MRGRHYWIACALLTQAAALPAQIAVSANDGKALPADAPDEPRTADTVTVMDLGHGTAKILATLHAPGTVVGPPGSVAVSADSRLAVVTAGQVLGEAGTPVPGDVVTVIDLQRPGDPRVVQTLHAGTGAAGVAINPAGTLALVANTGADSVSIFTIAEARLSSAGVVALDPKSRPVDVAFADGGRTAFVVAQGANSLVRLAIDGARVTRGAGDIAAGAQPYSLALNARTHIAYVSELGGRSPSPAPGPKPGAIGIIDLAAGRMIGQLDTGVTPEHVGLSPSGRYLQVTVNNGSTAPASSPAFHDYGLTTIYRIDGPQLVPVAEARTGRWCQGAVWSADEKQLFLQCSYRKQIEVYRFDGRTLTPAPAGPITLDARPGAIATARSR